MLETFEHIETSFEPLTSQPNRQRWGMMYYVMTRVRGEKKVSIMCAIREFAEINNIEQSQEALFADYYRLLKLHRDALKNGI